MKIPRIRLQDDSRPTRFHTERGLMPLGAWLDIPRALLARPTYEKSETPWLAPAAVSFLSRVIRDDWNVLEFGSGRSTVWFARRCRAMVSVEHDPEWYDLVCRNLSELGLGNCDLRLVAPDSYLETIDRFADDSFDLALVDGPEPREKHMEACATKVKQGGYLVLDDSDRASYTGLDAVLSGWEIRRCVGVRPVPFGVVETTIYRRPSK